MFLSGFLGFILGVLSGSFCFFNFQILIFLSFVFLSTFIYGFFVNSENKKILNLILAFVFIFTLGGLRISYSDLYRDSLLQKFENKKVIAEGTVVDEPDVRENGQKLTIKLTDFSKESSLSEKVLINASLYPEFHYGDKVKIETTFIKPKNIDSLGRVFDYRGFLRVSGIWYVGNYSKLEFISSNNGSLIKTFLFKIKSTFVESLKNVLPEPESSFMAGLLLGEKQSLGKKLLDEFSRSGVSHVVVLSGYNIAIVAKSVEAIVPKSFSFFLSSISILLFIIMSGGSSSASRAGIMILIALLAKKYNRENAQARIFALTIIIMILWNPLLLVFDPSFELSVLATAGIIFISPLVSIYLTKIPEKFGLREIVSSTISTQILVLPFLIYTTGLLSLVSLPVNILILGFIPITMLFGFILGIVGAFSLYLSFIPAFFAYIFLYYELSVVHFSASLPFSAISLPAFSFFWLLIIYILILIGFLKLKKLGGL